MDSKKSRPKKAAVRRAIARCTCPLCGTVVAQHGHIGFCTNLDCTVTLFDLPTHPKYRFT